MNACAFNQLGTRSTLHPAWRGATALRNVLMSHERLRRREVCNTVSTCEGSSRGNQHGRHDYAHIGTSSAAGV